MAAHAQIGLSYRCTDTALTGILTNSRPSLCAAVFTFFKVGAFDYTWWNNRAPEPPKEAGE
jgi:hypothetical protein